MDDVALLIDSGTEALASAGISEPRREAAALLAFALSLDRTFLVAHPEYLPDQAGRDRYAGFIDRRSRREPFHYITGSKQFYGLDFKVSPAVLIPRPETEMLVEQCIKFLPASGKPRFCEVGVGSGCISVSILANLPDVTAVGLEISEHSIAVANENAASHSVSARFDLRRSDLFGALEDGEKFDLIVANPPYIAIGELADLEPDVKDFEPKIALSGGADGLSVIRRIIESSPMFLKPNGLLVLEIGAGHPNAVFAMFNSERWTPASAENDFQGLPRTVSATLKDIETLINPIP